jgi:hypothetical protein
MSRKPRKNDRVIITEPRKFQGGTGGWKGRKARIKYVSPSGRYVHLVFDGETDVLWFFTNEFDILDETC